jgi:hypothetical protein
VTYLPDPGGNFASDAHRRVMAALANPDEDHISVDDLMKRIDQDEQLDLSHDEVAEILAELEAEGDATQTKNGWKNTKAGFEALTGPIATDGGRAYVRP